VSLEALLPLSDLPPSQELRELRATLFAAAPHGRAGSTARQYSRPWACVTEWATAKGLAVLPMEPRVAALVLTRELQRCYRAKLGPGGVLTMSAAIHFHHWVRGLPSPTGTPACDLARTVARRNLAAGRAARRGATMEEVDAALQALTAAGTLPSFVVAAMIVLGFYGFLRAGELLGVMWRDVSFSDDHCEVFIEQSKTDQERVGVWVVIAAADVSGRG